jgi:hypothetical protein
VADMYAPQQASGWGGPRLLELFSALLISVPLLWRKRYPIAVLAIVFAGGMINFPAAFAAVWRNKQGLDSQLAAALVDMNNVSFVLTSSLDAVMLAAAAVVIFRRGVLPRWLGWLGAGTAVLLILSAPAADRVPPLGILLTFVWIAGTSVVLTRRTLRPHPATIPAHA